MPAHKTNKTQAYKLTLGTLSYNLADNSELIDWFDLMLAITELL